MTSETRKSQLRIGSQFFFNVQVQGRTVVAHARDSIEFRSFSPATSTQSGEIVLRRVSGALIRDGGAALTIHSTPSIVPLMIAKNTRTPYEFEGIQTANTTTAQAAVDIPATSILPIRSLAHPSVGLPTAVPRFKNAVTADAWESDKPR